LLEEKELEGERVNNGLFSFWKYFLTNFLRKIIGEKEKRHKNVTNFNPRWIATTIYNKCFTYINA
jgi:hypothetical protein